MDKRVKIDFVEKIVKQIREYDNQRKIAYDCFGFDGESKLGESMAWIVDSLVIASSDAIGDSNEFLSWFLWECDCGDKPNECTIDGSNFIVDSVKSLIEVIEYYNRSCEK